jgi:N6-L-threonylcarbamoyladenine synthase
MVNSHPSIVMSQSSTVILGIETSCDETGIALVEDGHLVHASLIASSMEDFTKSGGVIPEQAARRQLELILPVLDKLLAQTTLTIDDIDAIAVTVEPGLKGSLLIGTTTARVLSSVWQKPLIEVHHTQGHLYSTWLHPKDEPFVEPQFPILSLSVSGGHSDIWIQQSHTDKKCLGTTRDDAAGEAFDKGAKMLGLGYPGGPAIAAMAESGDPQAYKFPLPLKGKPGYDFSFSGLKNALRLQILDADITNKTVLKNLAASWQEAICNHLCDRLQKVLKQHPSITEVHLVGGVAANTRLREKVTQLIDSRTLRVPNNIQYCTDNGAMIAAAGFYLNQQLTNEGAA